MQHSYKRQNLLKYRVIITLILVAMLGFILGSTWRYPQQYLVMKVYGKTYSDKLYKCDNAMRDHYIAKAKLMYQADKTNLQDLESSELSLIDCHSYDKLRKKLIWFGLTDNELGMLGLKAIEQNKVDLSKIVEIHEIND